MRIPTGVALAALVALAAATNGHAATFTVTRTDDPAPAACDSDCSLREAVLAANADPVADTISLPAGRYRLTVAGAGEDAAATGDLDLTGNVTIVGPQGPRETVIDAAGGDRVFEIRPSAAVAITDVTVTGGLAGDDGGGILNRAALTLTRVAVVDNAVFLPACTCSGGGIRSLGPLTLSLSTIARNRASSGGGISYAAALTVDRSTVTENWAGGPGSSASGGGLMGEATSTLALTNSTIARNRVYGSSGAGGGIAAPSTTLRNTIVAENLALGSATQLDNCGSGIALASNGYNLSDGADCGLAGTGDLQSTPAKLGLLRHNGGVTDTLALLQGSPAIDAGGGDCGATDQRGENRPRGGRCDIGAYEVAPPVATTAPAVAVGLTGAVLAGSIEAGRQVTRFAFEWWKAPAAKQMTPLQAVSADNGLSPVFAALTGLRPATTYHFRLVASNPDGSVFGPELTFMTVDRIKPVLRLLKASPGIFRAARGTKFSFTLSEAATVTFKFDRVRPGVRRKRRCVPKRPRLRGRACTRYLPVSGSFLVTAKAGRNTIAFDAKVNGRRLSPSAYRLRAAPKDASGNVGRAAIAAFRIVR